MVTRNTVIRLHVQWLVTWNHKSLDLLVSLRKHEINKVIFVPREMRKQNERFCLLNFIKLTTKFCKIKETEKLKQKSQDKYYISKTNNKNPAGAPHHINKTYYRDYHEYKKEKTHWHKLTRKLTQKTTNDPSTSIIAVWSSPISLSTNNNPSSHA